jgi:hypothetical protein
LLIETIKKNKAMNSIKKLSKSKPFYSTALQAFKKQFDCVELTKLYVFNGKVVAGEWIDSKGVFSFNCGCLLNYDTVVNIVD